MNEEEKAIERCKELIKPEHSNWIGITNQKAIETVLNLIDKQNKVIDLMAKGILNYDNQLVINFFKNKENVKEQYFRKVEEDE